MQDGSEGRRIWLWHRLRHHPVASQSHYSSFLYLALIFVFLSLLRWEALLSSFFRVKLLKAVRARRLNIQSKSARALPREAYSRIH